MLATPKSPFLLVGLFEALSQLLAMAAASCLPGVLLPVLGQTFLAWNLLLGRLIFGAK